jgi:hypothetical protein
MCQWSEYARSNKKDFPATADLIGDAIMVGRASVRRVLSAASEVLRWRSSVVRPWSNAPLVLMSRKFVCETGR